MTKVKICGLSSLEAVEQACQAGADYVGFVFAPSRRQVSLAQAQALAQNIPTNVQKVGVFVSPSLSDLEQAIEQVGLDLVQIHGDFAEEDLAKISRPTIRAYQVQPDLENFSSQADFLLFDAPVAGSGQPFDWQRLDSRQVKQPFFIAGGLDEDNVLSAIAHFTPYAVDVSSGVETDGIKDLAKIKGFIERVKHGLSRTK